MTDQELWDQMRERLVSVEDTTDLTLIEIQPDKAVYALGDRSSRPGWWTRKWFRDPFGKLWVWHKAEPSDR